MIFMKFLISDSIFSLLASEVIAVKWSLELGGNHFGNIHLIHFLPELLRLNLVLY